MNNDKIYPIGSVVLLKGGKHRVMIIGYTPMIGENKGRIYDYLGCFYPEGLVNVDQHMVFEHRDIEKVFGFGYSDDAEKEFRKKVIDLIGDIKDENGNMKMSANDLVKFIMNGGKK